MKLPFAMKSWSQEDTHLALRFLPLAQGVIRGFWLFLPDQHSLSLLLITATQFSFGKVAPRLLQSWLCPSPG